MLPLRRLLASGTGFASGAERAPPGIDIHLTQASADRQARRLADGGRGGAVGFLDRLAADGRRVLRGVRSPGARTPHSPADPAERSGASPAGE